jgi:hypothetical protein
MPHSAVHQYPFDTTVWLDFIFNFSKKNESVYELKIITLTIMSSVSTARFEKYKKRLDDATYELGRGCLLLIQPSEGWRYKRDSDIKEDFEIWCEEEEVFIKMTSSSAVPSHTWSNPPPDDGKHIGCRAMWGLRMFNDIKAEGDDYLEEVVDLILEEPDCAFHASWCPCKVPNNPWTRPDDVKLLDKINVSHSSLCECAGKNLCAQKIAKAKEAAAYAAVAAKAREEGERTYLAKEIKELEETLFSIPVSSDIDENKMRMEAMKNAKAWLEEIPGRTPPRTECICDSRWTNHCTCWLTIDYKQFMNKPTPPSSVSIPITVTPEMQEAAGKALPSIENMLTSRISRMNLDTTKEYIKVQNLNGNIVETKVGLFVRSYYMGSGDGMTVHWEFELDGKVTTIDDNMWGSIRGDELIGFKEHI